MRVGILGGGQLGRMIALAGYPLGLSFRFFDPNPDSPAGHIGELVVAGYDDEAALRAFAEGLDVATFEFESVPVAAVQLIAELVPVRPPARALAATQDRLAERQLCERLGIAVAQYAAVGSASELDDAAERVGFPSILKTRTLGYDGKGQATVHSADELRAAWSATGSRPSILERVVPFTRELSVIAVRGSDGTLVTYPLVENHHSEGILRVSFAPADVSTATDSEAVSIASLIAHELDYVGVLAIELFETSGGLIANEIAPRVHNSGHWTIEGAHTSQFENHVRAILGMPLGDTAAVSSSAMLNIIGRIPDLARLLAVPHSHLHLYGKSPVHRRKLGHVTVCAADARTVRETVAQLRSVIAVG